jgi:hypothetical protein
MSSWSLWTGIKDVLLFLLALYGAVLSTINWRQAVHKERREMVVSISSVIPVWHGGHSGNAFAKIEATNVGQRPVTVTTLALELLTGSRMFPAVALPMLGMPNTPLPVSLSDGQSAHCSISYKDIAAALLQHRISERTRLTPICLDSAGSIYKGIPWDVDPHEFSNM